MPIPEITHLQFLVLRTIAGRPMPGRELREKLGVEVAKKSLPAFYQMMSRLEDAGLVRGSYETKVINGQRIQERWYQVTALGTKAANDAIDFYTSTASAAANLREVPRA